MKTGPNPNEIKKYFIYLRKLECWFSNRSPNELPFWDEKYPQNCSIHWIMDKGVFHNQVSHILRKGSTRRNEHYGNVFSNCHNHHVWFEALRPDQRSLFLFAGQDIYKKYLTTVIK